MKLAAVKNHFAGWREWEMNPVVIKELRQGVRSWTVTGMLLLFLAVLFITSLGFLITESFDVNQDLQLGGTIFSVFMVILAAASMMFVPLYTGVRMAMERQENNSDLLYVTTMSSFRIILGKFLCSAYIVVLFFSACLPFMAFTNFLRGVDLPTVFFILFYLYLAICTANTVAIFFACLPISRAFKILVAIAGMVVSIFVILSSIDLSSGLMRSGVGAMMYQRDFWIGTLTYLGLMLGFTGLFFVLSVALISPPSANRALPVRVYLTLLWLLGGLLSVGWVIHTALATRIVAWVVPTFIIMMAALLVCVSNADQLSRRVRRTIPRSGLLRWPAFLFYNGAAGGLLWAGGIVAITGVVAGWLLRSFPKGILTSTDVGDWYACTSVYAFAYALTALFIQRKFFPGRPPKLAGLITILLVGGWALAPYILLFFANHLTWQSVEGFQPGNIFNVFSARDESTRTLHLVVALGWLVLALGINAKWFGQQIKNFRPPPVTDGNAGIGP